MAREIFFQNFEKSILRSFWLSVKRQPLESHQNGHIPLKECPHFFQRTQIRVRKSRFVQPFFTYSLRCECESNWRVTYEIDPNLVDFWRGSWVPIVRHADHDGAIRLLRLVPVPEKKMHKVRWVLSRVNL